LPAAQIGGSARVLLEHLDHSVWCGLSAGGVSGRSWTVPACPERQGARFGGVRLSVQARSRLLWPGQTAATYPAEAPFEGRNWDQQM